MIIPNQSNINFNFVLPDGQMEPGSATSNIVNTEILTYSVPKVKSGDKLFVREGETSVHTVAVTNNSQTKLFDMLFKDTMSDGASYVPGSVTVNGVSQPTYDPIAGFALPDLDPGQSVPITYTVRADSPMTQSTVTDFATLNYSVNDPERGNVNFSENTNTVSLEVVSDRIEVVKSVNKTYAVKGDLLHYTSTLNNVGTMTKTNIVFKDPIPSGTTFVAGSVKIDGTPYPAYDPQSGFPIADLAAGASATVEFDVEVN